MAVDAGFVRKIFAGLEQGDGAGFFTHVADDVDWTVEGTHPLAGRYRSNNPVCSTAWLVFRTSAPIIPRFVVGTGESTYGRSQGR